MDLAVLQRCQAHRGVFHGERALWTGGDLKVTGGWNDGQYQGTLCGLVHHQIRANEVQGCQCIGRHGFKLAIGLKDLHSHQHVKPSAFLREPADHGSGQRRVDQAVAGLAQAALAGHGSGDCEFDVLCRLVGAVLACHAIVSLKFIAIQARAIQIVEACIPIARFQSFNRGVGEDTMAEIHVDAEFPQLGGR